MVERREGKMVERREGKRVERGTRVFCNASRLLLRNKFNQTVPRISHGISVIIELSVYSRRRVRRRVTSAYFAISLAQVSGISLLAPTWKPKLASIN